MASQNHVIVPEIRLITPTNEAGPHAFENVRESDARGSSPRSIEPSTTETLETQLWEIAVRHANHRSGTKSFWPPALWEPFITQVSIEAELRRLHQDIAQDIASSFAQNIVSSSSKRSVKVFTILMFLNKHKIDILRHVLQDCKHGGIRDHHLPLSLDLSSGGKPMLLHHDGSEVSCCTAGWKSYQLETFDEFQRRLSPPIFGLKEDDNALIHLNLDDGDILPWCEVHDNLIPVPAMSGGYGTVSKVEIHPLCHKFGGILKAINVSNGLFAVKKLKEKSRVEFQREVDALSRFNGKVHKHLVTLLATFTQSGYYHMIFPWAEYDLEAYWNNHPRPDLTDYGLIRWVSEQCRGIMEAISLVHNPQHLTSNSRYGRHGDIKAENILWYTTGRPGDRGILVVSDFGLAAINSAKSRSMMPNNYADLKFTPSYRPPECDTLGGKITRAFDIWTLGCLYLELICWLLRGKRGKNAFDEARTTPFIFGSKVDIFFDIKEARQPTDAPYVFMVKEVVSKTMSELHDDPRCTDWMHDLLDVIEQDMLLVISSSQQRKTAYYLVDKLRAMDENAQECKAYCVNGNPLNRLSQWSKPAGVLSKLNQAAQRHFDEVKPALGVHDAQGKPLHRSLQPHEWRQLED